MLLSALDSRRVTRDIDTLVRGRAAAPDQLLASVKQVAGSAVEDGLEFRVSEARASAIRQDATYRGTRVTMPVKLGRARTKLTIDISVGDPVVPGPREVELPLLLGGTARLLGYPLEAVLAEKLVTAVSLGDLNGRVRDYADVWRLTRIHDVDGDPLTRAVRATATYRGVPLQSLSGQVVHLPQARQIAYRRWCVHQPDQRPPYPEQLGRVVAEVVEFADPVLDGAASSQTWAAAAGRWVRER